jgi:hypothetical protein
VAKIERCNFCIDYFWKDKIRKFNPDFKIQLKDGSITNEIPKHVVSMGCNWCPDCEDRAEDYYEEWYKDCAVEQW